MKTLSRLAGAGLASAFLAYMALPIAMPVIFSFARVWQGLLPEGFTLSSYANVLSGGKFPPALWLSFRVGGLTVLISLCLALPAAWSLHRMPGAFGRLLRQFLMIFPMVAGPLILAVGYLLTFNRPPLDFSGTIWIIVAGHVGLGFPFLFRAVLAEMESRDLVRLAEAAALCGAGALATWRLVLLPNLAGSAVSGALIVFAISFGEFEIAKMVGGFGFRTLPVLLFQSLREDFRTAAAVASILVYVALLGLIGVSLMRAAQGAVAPAPGKG